MKKYNTFAIKREFWDMWGANEEIHTVEYDDLLILAAAWKMPLETLMKTVEELPDPPKDSGII